MALTYRLLDVDKEWPLLEDEFLDRGVPLPDPRFAMIMGAFEDSTEPQVLQGFLVCQLQFHMEPLVLYCPKSLRGLVHAAEDELKARCGEGVRYYAFAPDDAIAGICAAFNMAPVKDRLFQKTL